MKKCKQFYCKIWFVLCLFSSIDSVAVQKEKELKNKGQAESDSKYSFRPLLIQGGKRLIQKTKDMKVDSRSITESELFFIDIDFQKKIFNDGDTVR